ncbi:MAG: hypothetical protein CL915_06465 [Deltaproteobacteria bacterium]|nr:hypothetical protein [Deltaproteobacteria bacterium]
METHALQPEELNASAKIAPCGWGPNAVGGQVFASVTKLLWVALIDHWEHHNTMWQKSEMGT